MSNKRSVATTIIKRSTRRRIENSNIASQPTSSSSSSSSSNRLESEEQGCDDDTLRGKLGLIFPHQLFKNHPVLNAASKTVLIYEPLILGGDKEWPLIPHAKKRLLHQASMASFLENYNVVEAITGGGLDSLDLTGVKALVYCRVVDDVLERRLHAFCKNNDLKVEELESPGFVTPKEWGRSFFDGKKKPLMKTFYEAQRKRMNVLVNNNSKPTGGKWSFDDENRHKFPVKEPVPSKPSIIQSDGEKKLISQSISDLQGIDVFGNYDNFIYPISHQSAEAWLEEFLTHRLKKFGTYEDALTSRSTFLFHSVLSPLLNTGLLTPQQVINRALDYGKTHGIAINNQEGFIRQIIGWREYMSIMYEMHGRSSRVLNFWKFTERMPKSIYNGKTGIPIVDDVLYKVKETAYAHHIERLMVLGNFFLLLRVHPNDVYQWFSEMFIDAFDWVMVPNVYSMSQFSDGGLLVTKPYVSGSNYLKKMSDYKAGEWCVVWDALFWSFIDDHREFFQSQYRMKMMVSHLDRMTKEKLEGHHKVSREYRAKLQLGGYLGDDGKP